MRLGFDTGNRLARTRNVLVHRVCFITGAANRMPLVKNFNMSHSRHKAGAGGMWIS